MKKFLSGLPPLVSTLLVKSRNDKAPYDGPSKGTLTCHSRVHRMKIPSRAENEAIRKMLDGSWEPEESPLSGYIDRPSPLPWNVEHELREACAAIVRDSGNAEKESKGNEWFNFSNPSKSKAQSRPVTGKKSAKRDESQNRVPRETADEADDMSKDMEDVAEKKHDIESEEEIEKKALQTIARPKAQSKPEQPILDNSIKVDEQTPASHSTQPPTRPLSRRVNPFRRTIQLEPLNTTVGVPTRRPQTAPTGHSSTTSESAIVSASTDVYPLSASTGITSVGMSPALKSHGTVLQPTSTTIPTRLSQEDSVSQPSQKSSLEKTSEAVQPPKTVDREVSKSALVKAPKEGFAASIKKFVRNRTRSISKSREDISNSEKRASFGGALRNLSLRRNKSMGNLSSGIQPQSQADLDNSKASEDAPPVPKLETIVKNEYNAPVHIASLAKPQLPQTAMPATTVSLQSAKANIVEVQARSPKTSISLSTPEALRKHSLASSSIDSCFTPPIPQTPDKHQLQNHLQHAGLRDVGAGHVDVLKAARSLESLRAQHQLQQQKQTGSSDSPICHLRSGVSLPRKMSVTGVPSHPSSRPTSRGTMKSAASAHSSRSPSRASRSISVSGQLMPLPPLTAKYSIMPNTSILHHSRSPSQPSGLRHPVYAHSHTGISSTASSVVYLPSTLASVNVGRPGTSGGESSLVLRAFPTSSMAKMDLPSSGTTPRPASSNSRRMTTTSINVTTTIGLGLNRASSNTSLATSAAAVNFSRKLAGTEESAKRESVLSNMNATALPPVPPSMMAPKGGRLRRVLSSFSVKRPKKF